MDLFYDYRTNVESYPAWQEWLRRLYAALCSVGAVGGAARGRPGGLAVGWGVRWFLAGLP
jgi:hypothetical protein